MGKIKLSDTLQILTAQINKITGGNLELELVLEESEVVCGAVLRARAVIGSPQGKDRTLNYMTIGLRGQIQRDGKWQRYVQRVEVAHGVALPAGHEYILPFVIKIPHEVVWM